MPISSTDVPVPDDVPILDVDPYADAALADPFPLHAAVRAAGPVVFVPKYGVYFMGRHADVLPTLKDWRRFSSTSGSGIADIRRPDAWRAPSPIVEVDPPRHTAIRKALQRVLSPRLIKSWGERFRPVAGALVDTLVERGRVDAATDLAEAFVCDLFPAAIGWADHPERRARLMLLGALNFDGQGPRNDRFLATEAAAAGIMEWNDSQMRRDALAADGFGREIYEAADRGEIEPEVAPLLIRSFIRGGLDTTTSMITAAVHHLAEAPAQYAALRADPTLVRRVLDESMRLETPIQTVCRLTMEDVEIDGVPVPANNKIILLLASANRDPAAWDDPDAFRLDRPPQQSHVALGAGIHMCIGQMIARMEGELILEALIERVSEIVPAGPAERRLNNNLRAHRSVPVDLVAAR